MRVLLLLLLVTLVYSQTWQTWTAETIVTSPQMGSGYFEATVKYDWPAGLIEVAFNGVNYKEFYKFNVDRGYNSKVSTGQFTYQYMYKTSTKCPCEVTGLQKAMPAWFPGSTTGTEPFYKIPYWTSSKPNDDGLDSLTGTQVLATKYFPNLGFKVVLPLPPNGPGGEKSFVLSNGLWLSETGSIKGFMLTDPNDQQRTFTIKTITEGQTGKLGLVAPPDQGVKCPCKKLVDVAISLDRSGSISYDQWLLEYQFVKDLANSFEYGPDAAALAIGNWNKNQWSTVGLPDGVSRTNVMSAINNMKCCDLGATGSASCCCCNTPIGGGIYLGGKMLLEGRPKATKVLILLTDGCQNHIWSDKTNPPSAVSCGCSSEKICAQNLTCTGDITKWYQIVTTQYVPGTKVIVLGVGSSDTICYDQLVMAAGNDATNVYNPQNWDSLQTLVQTISATACTATVTPCTGCCGLCTCGECIQTPKCFNESSCEIGTLDGVTKCCRSDPKVCPPKPCQTVSCVTSLPEGCRYDPIQCRANDSDGCSYWYCNSSSVICKQAKKPDNELPASCKDEVIDECVVDADCFGGDPCKTYECYKPQANIPATCRVTTIVCPPSDNCTTRYCKPGSGCVNVTKTCNDRDNCTIDACLPNVQGGCVYTSVADKCVQPEDYCKKAICHKEKGCIEIPKNCSEDGYYASLANCTIASCNKTCFNLYVCYTPPPTGVETFPTTVVLASALGTAAIIGIVIAAAVLVVGLGGAAGVAIAGAAGAGGVALVAANPIYAPSGASGTNALFKDQS